MGNMEVVDLFKIGMSGVNLMFERDGLVGGGHGHWHRQQSSYRRGRPAFP